MYQTVNFLYANTPIGITISDLYTYVRCLVSLVLFFIVVVSYGQSSRKSDFNLIFELITSVVGLVLSGMDLVDKIIGCRTYRAWRDYCKGGDGRLQDEQTCLYHINKKARCDISEDSRNYCNLVWNLAIDLVYYPLMLSAMFNFIDPEETSFDRMSPGSGCRGPTSQGSVRLSSYRAVTRRRWQSRDRK